MKKETYFTLLVLISLAATGCRTGTAAPEEDFYTLSNDTVYLSDTPTTRGIFKTTMATSESVHRNITTAGTIQPIPTHFAYIAPPFAGRITKSYISVGQKVRANSPIFEIVSPEFTAMQKEFYQASSERDMAVKDMERKKELYSLNLCSAREFEEALNAYRIADREYENTRAALQTYHVDIDNMVMGQPLIVKSPISGEVIENNIVVGLYLHSESDPVAVVADMSKVWVTAQVKEKDIRFVNEGDVMKVTVEAFPGTEIEGTVFHIEEAVDEDTRSIKVLSVCDNRQVGLKLGMYATVSFRGIPGNYTVIPEKSLLQDDRDSYIFVCTENGDKLLKRTVNVDFTMDGFAYVSQGISEGEKLVSEGGYYFR